ncbi:MAG: hypothetical protein JO186_09070 [Actinobacteria bacterium]|nr:hypothetical protein [Actinomycetota bacterium]
MQRAPQSLTLKDHRDARGHHRALWARRGGVTLLALIPLFALLNAFGQRSTASSAVVAAARLQVVAPTAARSGLVYAARFSIVALHELKQATLVLDPGWAEQYTVNGLAPQPLSQGSSNGKLVFGFGHVPQGKQVTFFLSLQVNPTNFGRRTQNVWLYDGKQELLELHRSITIWP